MGVDRNQLAHFGHGDSYDDCCPFEGGLSLDRHPSPICISSLPLIHTPCSVSFKVVCLGQLFGEERNANDDLREGGLRHGSVQK